MILQWCDHESSAATHVWSTFLSIKTNILSNWYLSDHVHVVNILCSRFKIKYYPSLCFAFPWNLNCNVCRLQHFCSALLIALVYNTSTNSLLPANSWSQLVFMFTRMWPTISVKTRCTHLVKYLSPTIFPSLGSWSNIFKLCEIHNSDLSDSREYANCF